MNGSRNGKGKYSFKDGTMYEGEFKDDDYNGKGKLTDADGSVYEGEFKDGREHGKGKKKFI